MLLELVVVAGLCGYRLARAVAVDKVGEPLRRRVGRWAYRGGDPDRPVARHKAWLAALVVCPYCVGVYLTVAVSLVLTAQVLDLPVVVHLVLAGAATGVQVLVTSTCARLEAEPEE